MNNNNHKSSIRKSSSLSSLNQRTTFDNSILTSTKNLEFILPNYNKDDRRKSIMATPYRSKNIQGFNIMNNLRISRNLYFEAIPLLVEGDAKRKYIKNRKQILSFDDFYEFLLLQFDIIDTSISSSNLPEVVNNDFSKPYSSISNKTIDNQTENTTYFSDTINISRQTPTFNSTAKVDFGVINIIGETSDIKSTMNNSSSSIILLDETISDLRRTIVGDLIKNQKVFKSGKDDVRK
ncbi:unnamed protein product [Rotaria sordida]|uniref:Uncharacterized protein n=1 Tax=Rotaria sordida TaxID=392033 RepID=A0A815HB19_9BILA|nr:unnamed protein product [Rotaria sordida]CAF1349791.1 unnamed protein product [Rotaria sordida]